VRKTDANMCFSDLSLSFPINLSSPTLLKICIFVPRVFFQDAGCIHTVDAPATNSRSITNAACIRNQVQSRMHPFQSDVTIFATKLYVPSNGIYISLKLHNSEALWDRHLKRFKGAIN